MLSVLFQMTYPGAPSIYYGDEIGMLGRTDPDCRRTFNWNRETWDMEILDFTKNCIRIRKEHARCTHRQISDTLMPMMMSWFMFVHWKMTRF